MTHPDESLCHACLELSESILPLELITIGLNPEQIQYFSGLKKYYEMKIGSLLAVLKGYSRATFVRDYCGIEYTDSLDEYLESQLCFYELVRYSWNEIESVFAKYLVQTPEEAILVIYRYEALHAFAQCLAVDSRIYPTSIYREYNTAKDIQRKKESGEKLNKKEEKLAAKAKRRYYQNETKDLAVAQDLIERCESIWSKSKDTIIANRYEAYRLQKDSLISETKKYFHSDFNPVPIGWKNGKRVS